MSGKVDFLPTKDFFIETITRDIKVRDCIFDLLDNAVDSYVRHSLKGKREVDLQLSKRALRLFDDCGGISKTDLQKHVFRLGFSDLVRSKPTIGVYGIGLKRAIFKLGKTIVFETDDGRDFCRVELDVTKWRKKSDSDWTVDMEREERSRLRTGQNPYTLIEITDLSEDSAAVFTQSFFNSIFDQVGVYCRQRGGCRQLNN